MDNDNTDWIDEETGALLARYVAGRCSQEEEAAVLAWIAGAAGRDEVVASLRAIWDLAQRSRAAWDVDAAWDELRERLEARRARRPAAATGREPAAAEGVPASAEEVLAESGRRREPARYPVAVPGRARPASTPGRTRRAPKSTRRRVPVWAVRAAAVVLLAAGGAAVWSTRPWEGVGAPRVVEMREFATARAQRAEVRLPDGSRVALNVDSRLRVPEDYGRRSRDVYLEGEARFEVEHDERRPFRVHADGVVAEDLGTVFGVRRYGDGSPATVVVAEGVVEVQATPAPAESTAPAGFEAAAQPPRHRLDPGDLARVRTDGTVEVAHGVDVEALLAFADGRLAFHDTPLAEAAAQLGRWYDLDVRLADPSLAALPLTASFQYEPISRVLELIALSLDLQHERDGSVVTFSR